MLRRIFYTSCSIFLVSFIACNSSTDKSKYIVTKPIALFYNPDSSSIAKMEKEMDTASFADYLEDNQTYYLEANLAIEGSSIPTDITDAKTIEFHQKDGSKYIVSVDTLDDSWGIFLFDGINTPNHYSMSDMVPAIEEFMDKIR